MNSTNTVVANAMAAHGVARNSVEVEVSLMYAGRVQHAMRDAARSVSGVRISGTNTLYCPDEDAADEVVDILEQAGVPKREISLNAKRVARNAMYNRFDKNSVKTIIEKLKKDTAELTRLIPEVQKAKAIISELDPYSIEDARTGDEGLDKEFIDTMRRYIPFFKKMDSAFNG